MARSVLSGDAAAAADKRRWPRTRIGPELALEMDQGQATMVDVSYGGCRLRFHQGADLPIPSSLSLPIPTSEVPITGTPVWRESELDGDVFGVAVAGASEAVGA